MLGNLPFLLCLAICVNFGIRANNTAYSQNSKNAKREEEKRKVQNQMTGKSGFTLLEKFENLPPEAKKETLSKLLDEIDDNKDGHGTLEEVKRWLKYKDVDEYWRNIKPAKKDKISWGEYKAIYLEEDDNSSGNKIERRRWDVADRNKDNQLTKAEFSDFINPETSKHMKDILVTEFIENLDKDDDGKISLYEYIQLFAPVRLLALNKGKQLTNIKIEDMPQMEGYIKTWISDPTKAPAWLKQDREQFENIRDIDKDGYLDIEEVRQWIKPSNKKEESERIAIEIFGLGDANGDQKLTEVEITSKYKEFIPHHNWNSENDLLNHDEL